FQDVQPLRLAVDGRHREDIEALQEAHLADVVGRFDMLEVAGQPGPLQDLALLLEKEAIVAAEPTGHAQAARRRARLLTEETERLHRAMKTLFRADAREVANRERRFAPRRRRLGIR